MNSEIAVISLGKSGLSTVNFLLAHGIVPSVFDTRENPAGKEFLPNNVPLVCGELDPEKLKHFKTLIVGPGLSLETPALAQVAKLGVSIIGDIEVFAQYAKAPTVGITGSNGKSTVTTLVALMAKADNKKCGMGGNIGIPALDVIADDVDVYVLELSSFELETTSNLKLRGATILNLSEDHLDRYQGSMELYLKAKQRIFKHAENIIVNREDPTTIPKDGKYCSSFGGDECDYGRIVVNGKRYLSFNGQEIIAVDDVLIKGRHNEMNALAAIALADTLGISRQAQINVLKTFTGLEHRCQLVRELNGVRYYNDSKATNVGSTLAAVAGLKEGVKGKIILLAGGLGKGQNFKPIQNMLGHEIGLMLCFGKDGKLLSSLGDEALLVEDMAAAIKYAHKVAESGDVVLLAPACASLDQFKSFENRGDIFTDLVKGL
jgi:UDP-N-acetylmuramoylalanine--D-glutamate ligase